MTAVKTGRRPGFKGHGMDGYTPIQRLMAHIEMTPGPLPTPCWPSTYWIHPEGYARIQVNGRPMLPHRLSYEHYVGPIPDGLTIDHLCRNRACINPLHLEAVTYRENMLRGMSPAAIAYRTNTCKHGHSLADAYFWGNRRYCKPCAMENQRKKRDRRKQRAIANMDTAA